MCCLQETQFRTKDTCRLKVRGCKKLFHANVNDKKPGVVILISDKMKSIAKHKEGHYNFVIF